jgi:hypothetical protein
VARRRVFRTRAECPGVETDLGPSSNKLELIGQTVTFARSISDFEVAVCLGGALVGHLDPEIGKQVAMAIDRGQSFVAVIINAYPIYDDSFNQISAHIDIKVEYLLDRGQPAVEAPAHWRAVECSPEASSVPRSFFTKVAGVTFEGRQRIIGRCSVGERLRLVRDPTDRYDKGAIKVIRLNGEQLGFVPAHVSRGDDPSGLALRMDRGDKYQCRIKDLTGGGEQNLGVNIEIAECDEVDWDPVVAKAPEPLSKFVVNPIPWLLAAAALLLVIFAFLHNS